MRLSYRNERSAKAIAAVWGRPLEPFDCYTVKAVSDDESELLIYDYIGFPFNDAGELVRTITSMRGKKITVRINSPGGDVFDAIALYNALKAHNAKVTTRAEALAASAASIILLAGREAQAYQNAMLMIHEPWILAAGNQYDLREMADLLAKVNENFVGIYADNSNVSKRELREMLKAETWFTAKEAKGRGFVDTILDGSGGAKSQFDLSMFAHTPSGLAEAGERFQEAMEKLEIGIRLAELKQTLDPNHKTH